MSSNSGNFGLQDKLSFLYLSIMALPSRRERMECFTIVKKLHKKRHKIPFSLMMAWMQIGVVCRMVSGLQRLKHFAVQQFQQLDLDNTGRIDFDQFVNFYQNIFHDQGPAGAEICFRAPS